MENKEKESYLNEDRDCECDKYELILDRDALVLIMSRLVAERKGL